MVFLQIFNVVILFFCWNAETEKCSKVLEIKEKLIGFLGPWWTLTLPSFCFFLPPPCCAVCGILLPEPGTEPRPERWKSQVLTFGLQETCPFFPHSFFTNALYFHIPNLWTIQTGNTSLVDQWREFCHSYLLMPDSWYFPTSRLCRVSSVRNPVKPTPPG